MSERKKMVTAEEIEEAALELDKEEFDSLLDRLSAQRDAARHRVASWVREAESRVHAVSERKIAMVDADEVLADSDDNG